MSIDVTRDLEGIQQAIADLLEEAFVWSRVAPSMDGAAEGTRERMMGTLPPRKLSPGYYRIAQYLLWLEERIRVCVPVSWLPAADADGLCVLARARAQFENNHPTCSVCGAPQDSRFATSCHQCGAEFKRGK